jgi:ParB family chromosome partitioning protein
VGNNFITKTSSAELADVVGESKNQIFRFIRLTELIPQLLDMVDNSVVKEKNTLQMALRPAVELSYLSEEQQHELLEEIVANECTPSHEQAIKMRRFAEEGRLDENVIHSIMQEEKANQVEQFKMPRDRISRFFPAGTPAQKIEDTIVKALELLRQRERNRDAR